MEFKSPSQCPKTLTVRRNPSRRAKKTVATDAPVTKTMDPVPVLVRKISQFPIEEILQCEIDPTPPPKKVEEGSENLRVFLRIRPVIINQPTKKKFDGVRGRSSRGLLQKSEGKTKKENEEVCLLVNGSQSVTLSPPQSMQDSKRLKSEVYDGFSHVFEPESCQDEVYEKVMESLVLDFIGGKSGMLVAMGPTGSGKTHTIFGCPREPGLVPRALRKIFDATSDKTRSFYMSMIEIRSEKAKGERIIDLSADGDDLCLQQSAIKDLPEIMVSSVAEAEAFIGRGLLRRATAMTNSNSQSSRSQCIINIRGAPKVIDGESEVSAHNVVLSIIDLAGAEREKKTGNQGSRLLESNFINKTSMVFGQCLRSLLEHQKNPKKPLQKHYQNSLLTKYLRDYFEGRKRMTLILTVKPGGDDYLDTSFLLRQASPFMKIKFTAVEEPSQKRHSNKLPQGEQSKRRKLGNPNNLVIDESKSVREGHEVLEKELDSETLQQYEPTDSCISSLDSELLQQCEPTDSLTSSLDSKTLQQCEPTEILISSLDCETLQHGEHTDSPISSPSHVKVDVNGNVWLEEYSDVLEDMKRKEKVMQKFSKAMWNILKQYKIKLEESEKENHSLKIIIEEKDARCDKLEKDLADMKSCSSYRIQHSTESLESLPEKGSVANSEDVIPLRVKGNSSRTDISGVGPSKSVASSKPQLLVGDEMLLEMARDTVLGEKKVTSSNSLLSQNKEENFDACTVRGSEHEHASPCKFLNEEKPKRRLLPASSILLKEINEFNLEVENKKPRESKGGRKLAPQGRTQTQGNISLLKLLNTLRI